ncbi:hypothetical protein J2T57_001494 [Natronocella acetinitrilica]|uniref:DUF1566 domain-containing protein n=1 Tax=Natronocella acetinitrilica TaxID=414046 RepID=A0AAE3KFS4_9GAMM|nr:hypothetical protein [Natronocella acetinitrilica]MCP1674392.1 hypothetical protein [Natronocella acetinitrilica]
MRIRLTALTLAMALPILSTQALVESTEAYRLTVPFKGLSASVSPAPDAPPAAPTEAEVCAGIAIGESCVLEGETVFYAGSVDARRVYFADAAQADWLQWQQYPDELSGTNSFSDGIANTDAIVASGLGNPQAALACRARGERWFLPALFELQLLSSPAFAGSGSALATSPDAHWTSTQYSSSPTEALSTAPAGGSTQPTWKAHHMPVHCARHAP